MAGMAHYAPGHSLPVPYGYFPQGVPHTQAAGSPTMVRLPCNRLLLPDKAVAAGWCFLSVWPGSRTWLEPFHCQEYHCGAGARAATQAMLSMLDMC